MSNPHPGLVECRLTRTPRVAGATLLLTTGQSHASTTTSPAGCGWIGKPPPMRAGGTTNITNKSIVAVAAGAA
ncbi:hypothetical protein N7490_012061 [Penicillium lividum]|nr:hypothetical protein N7490_012061 [Penicillium lividum]